MFHTDVPEIVRVSVGFSDLGTLGTAAINAVNISISHENDYYVHDILLNQCLTEMALVPFRP